MNVKFFGKMHMVSTQIGEVNCVLLARGMESDKDGQFGVFENGIQFTFRASDFQSNRDAFLAARAWNSNPEHFNRYGGLVMEACPFGFIVRPVYIGEVK